MGSPQRNWFCLFNSEFKNCGTCFDFSFGRTLTTIQTLCRKQRSNLVLTDQTSSLPLSTSLEVQFHTSSQKAVLIQRLRQQLNPTRLLVFSRVLRLVNQLRLQQHIPL